MKTNREKSHETAQNNAIENLRAKNLKDQLKILSVDFTEESDSYNFKAFGKELSMGKENFKIYSKSTGEEINTVERITILHYLLCEIPVKETGNLISFRDFPGGSFYYEPFRARTAIPIINIINNDLDRLKKALTPYSWDHYDAGDLGAKIHIVGNIYLYIIYWTGDDEFPPRIEVLFDASVKHVLNAEDAVAVASRICLSFIK